VPKKKKPTVKRTRRDPYTRALSDATTRLDKAVAEEQRCRSMLQYLSMEIPRLRKIIEALQPATSAQEKKDIPFKDIQMDKYAPKVPIAPAFADIPLPDHLKRFIKPRDAEPKPEPEPASEFLADAEGEEVLP